MLRDGQSSRILARQSCRQGVEPAQERCYAVNKAERSVRPEELLLPSKPLV